MEIYMRFLLAGAIMMVLSFILMIVGIKFQSLWAEVISMAVALAGAMSLFRGLAEFLQKSLSGSGGRGHNS